MGTAWRGMTMETESVRLTRDRGWKNEFSCPFYMLA